MNSLLIRHLQTKQFLQRYLNIIRSNKQNNFEIKTKLKPKTSNNSWFFILFFMETLLPWRRWHEIHRRRVEERVVFSDETLNKFVGVGDRVVSLKNLVVFLGMVYFEFGFFICKNMDVESWICIYRGGRREGLVEKFFIDFSLTFFYKFWIYQSFS